MSLSSLLLTLKGGAGSGNFGHSGRPGKHGGSSSGVFSSFNSLAFNDTRKKYYEQFQKAVSALDKDKVEAVGIVGSFVSSKETPGDLDMVVLTKPGVDHWAYQPEFYGKIGKNDLPNVRITFLPSDGIEPLIGKNMLDYYKTNTKARYGVDPIIKDL